jgi:muconate cycloisomerase
LSKISQITTQRFDLDLNQSIMMSIGTMRKQNVLLVRIRDSDGAEGVGEAIVMGGPFWGSESIEGVQAAIEKYIAPSLLNQPTDTLGSLSVLLGKVVRGNAAARSAVEMALFDLVGRKLNVPIAMLMGGPCRKEIPVAWTLSTGTTQSDIEEGERAIAAHGFRRFKLKFGHDAPEADVERCAAILSHFQGRATVIADVNQGWDEATAVRMLPRLADAGLEALEQPLPVDQDAVSAALQARFGVYFIADEAVTGAASASRIAATRAAGAIALKPNRDGGLTVTRDVAIIALAAGIKLYGGTMLETSWGTAASLQCFSTIPDLALGSELFGPLRLADDITETPLTVRNGMMAVPLDGPGIGLRLDEEKIAWLSNRA